MGTKSVNNQSLMNDSTCIILTLGYESKVILPVSDGLKILDLMSKGIHIKERYNEPMKIMEKQEDITIKFISATDVKKLKLEALIEQEEN